MKYEAFIACHEKMKEAGHVPGDQDDQNGCRIGEQRQAIVDHIALLTSSPFAFGPLVPSSSPRKDQIDVTQMKRRIIVL